MQTRPGAVLEAARVQAGMSLADVWLAYLALGGMQSPEVVESILEGEAEVASDEYDLLAQTMNERFMDRGVGHPVPYHDEID